MLNLRRITGPGPFRADQLRAGDPYELSNGHPIYGTPFGGDLARHVGMAFLVIDSDPAVDDAGVDPGFTSDDGKNLRAPDVAVGVPDAPGWIHGVPPLAVEYASVGQDEAELDQKIAELLAAGTRYIWVARLQGVRRVEVHQPGVAASVVGLDGVLEAPGILKNPVPVAALFDREVAHEQTLKNLLQRHGFVDLDDAVSSGREEGRVVVARTLKRLMTRRFGDLDAATTARIDAADLHEIERWTERAFDAATPQDVFV